MAARMCAVDAEAEGEDESARLGQELSELSLEDEEDYDVQRMTRSGKRRNVNGIACSLKMVEGVEGAEGKPRPPEGKTGLKVMEEGCGVLRERSKVAESGPGQKRQVEAGSDGKGNMMTGGKVGAGKRSGRFISMHGRKKKSRSTCSACNYQ